MKNNMINFYKMTGGGNDFVVVDNRKDQLPKDFSPLAKELCVRKFSIGADGLLVLEESDVANFRMHYYNSDGSRAEMCGNGARCIAQFAYLLKAAPQKMSFVTDAGVVEAEILERSVKLKITPPKDLRLDFPIRLDPGKEFNVSFINSGVPHTVLMVSDIEKVDVEELGKTIRFHKEFAPAGANANFVLVHDKNNISLRTYERGVEQETLACGTGAIASSLICAAKGMTQTPVTCKTRGGENLTVHFQKNFQSEVEPLPPGDPFTEVYLEGAVKVCFTGNLQLV